MPQSIPLTICVLSSADISALYQMAEAGGHRTETDYFETAYQEQVDAKRLVFLALQGDRLAGYVHLNFYPRYTPFLRLEIPEIQDLFVHPDFRRQGIGETLILRCETAAQEARKSEIGIGVGVTAEFGAAQRLYTQLGYVPDGAGAVFDRTPVSAGDVRPIDDRLCLMLVKNVSSK